MVPFLGCVLVAANQEFAIVIVVKRLRFAYVFVF